MPAAWVGAAVGVAGLISSSDAASTAADNQAAANATQASVANRQLDISQQQQDISNQQYQRYLKNYAPLEDQMVNQARDYGSNSNRERAASTAEGEVTSAYSGLRSQLNSTPGLDPSSAKYLDTVSRLGVQEAGQKAAAGTTARTNTDQIAAAKMSDAVSLGKGLPASSEAALAGAGATAGGAGSVASSQALQSQYALNAANMGLGGAWSGIGKSLASPVIQNSVNGWFNSTPTTNYVQPGGVPTDANNQMVFD